MRNLALIALLVCGVAPATTLEKLSLEQMAEQSTLIVRGRIAGCIGESRGALIYTRCRAAVSERWKGQAGAQVEFLVPGGTARGLKQTFAGTPKFTPGSEYVLFLWTGRSGVPQIIGLSQGSFDLKIDAKGQAIVKRGAGAEKMVNSSGQPVQDAPVEMAVSELRERVRRALGEAK